MIYVKNDVVGYKVHSVAIDGDQSVMPLALNLFLKHWADTQRARAAADAAP